MAIDLTGPRMQHMLECAENSLTTPVGLSALYPGAAVAFDNCCEDQGQLWVRLIEMEPGGNPRRGAGGQPCGVVLWRATFGIGVIRCVHTLDEQGYAPTAPELTADTLAMTQDMTDLSEAIQCCMKPTPDIVRWTPLGPEGGCAGGEWIVTANIDNCGCDG